MESDTHTGVSPPLLMSLPKRPALRQRGLTRGMSFRQEKRQKSEARARKAISRGSITSEWKMKREALYDNNKAAAPTPNTRFDASVRVFSKEGSLVLGAAEGGEGEAEGRRRADISTRFLILSDLPCGVPRVCVCVWLSLGSRLRRFVSVFSFLFFFSLGDVR